MLALPALQAADAMDNANLPWSIKGISPEARSAAKEHAAESGQPMGAWLSQIIHSVSQQERDEAMGGPPAMASAILPPISAEKSKPYDDAGFDEAHGDLAALAKRIAKAERWTARSVGPLRQAIDEIARRLDALEQTIHRSSGRAGGEHAIGGDYRSGRS